MQVEEPVKCVFGCEKQAQAMLIDRDWCERNCETEDVYERIQRPNRCFWHFAKFGLDMRKK